MIEGFKFESRFNKGVQFELIKEDIRLRVEKEIEDTEFRLKRGSDLGRFGQFWDGDGEYDTLFKCRYSRSKWLFLWRLYATAPLET